MEHTQPYQQRLNLSAGMQILSGGFAGVDRAALDVGRALGLSVGEPRGRPVHDSDATLILTLGTLDGGTQLIADIARRTGKPCLAVQLDAPDAIEKARAWMDKVKPQSLNIAGPRGSRQPGTYGRAYAFLSRMLKAGNYVTKTH